MQKLITFMLVCLALGQTLDMTQCQVTQALDMATGFIPTVVVDQQRGDSSVDVHLGQIVDLGTDKRTDKSRVDLTVLGGLVTVATNKTQLPDGSSSGPVIVTVFGIPVYVGSGTSRPKPPRVPRPPKNPRPEASPLLPEIKDKSARFEKELTNRAEAKLEQKEKSKMAELLAQMSKKLDEQSETIRQLQAGRATSSESQVERSTSTTKKLSDNRPSTGKLDATTTPKPIRFEDVTDILRRRRDEMSS